MTDKKQLSVELKPSNLLPTKKRGKRTMGVAPTIPRMSPELGGLPVKEDNRRSIRKGGIIY